MRALARLQAGQMVQAMAMGTGTATVMDGIALAWFPDLYGAGAALHAGAGGTILWGGGVGLLLAFWFDRARRSPA
jgi:glutamate/tyrosine decarboxylase-like PLP-dependent enzyme